MSTRYDTNERNQTEPNVSSERRVLEGHTRPCEECGAVDWSLDTTRGEVTCNSCGLVVEENVLDPGAEWTQRDRGEDRSRVGAPMTYTLADRGLNTTIDVRDLNTGAASRSSTGVGRPETVVEKCPLRRVETKASLEVGTRRYANMEGLPAMYYDA